MHTAATCADCGGKNMCNGECSWGNDQCSKEEYAVRLDGNVTNSLIIHLCGEDFIITGSASNVTVVHKLQDVDVEKSLKEGKSSGRMIISVPCEGKMKLEGDITNVVIVVGKLKANKKGTNSKTAK